MASYHRNETAGPATLSTKETVTFRSLKDDLDALRAAAPAGVADLARTTIGKSEQGRDIHLLRLGRNPAMPVLIAGCHHAREWISVEMPYLIADYLVRHYATDPKVQRLVDARDLWIVPLINPDGHERSVTVNRDWRTNDPPAAGGRVAVDLNRNYATSTWGIAKGNFSTKPGQDNFRGPSAGFAVEVQAMQDLIRAQRFKATLDYHSRGRWVLFPWSGKVDAPPAKVVQLAAHYGRVVDSKGAPRGIHYTQIQASGLYPELNRLLNRPPLAPEDGVVPGGMMDYVLEQLPGALAVTVELEPDPFDPRAFNLPESEIDPTFDLHRAAMLAFLNSFEAVRNPPVPRPLLLTEGVDQTPAFFQADPSTAFEAY